MQSPSTTVSSKDNEELVAQGMKMFFKLQRIYQESVAATKEKNKKNEKRGKKGKKEKKMPLCPQCRQPVGMTFSIQGKKTDTLLPTIADAMGYRRFTATCGADVPCVQLDFTVSNRTSFDTLIRHLNENINGVKLHIIQLKNQLAFGCGEEDAIQISFNQAVVIMNQLTEFASRIIEENIRTNHNPAREARIKQEEDELHNQVIPQFKQAIATYSQSQSAVDLQNAMKYYLNDLLPQVRLVREQKWDNMFMGFEDHTHQASVLVQRENNLSNSLFFDPAMDRMIKNI